MTVSIITATFNSAATVAETMQCIADQDYPDIEHLIVDGGSTDQTLDIVRKYPHAQRVISEKDEGIYDAMNKGITLAKGDIIGILNSDDVYVSRRVISRVVQVFEDPAIQACYADLQYVHPVVSGRIVRTWKSGYFRLASFYWGWMPPHPTFFVRRSVYEKLGLFNTRLKSASDYEMMLRILLKYRMKAAYIPEVTVRMRAGGTSNASLRNRLKANKEDRMAWRINDLRPYFFTTYLKPLRKIFQFAKKRGARENP
jgi:glycosyltransferase involved in cell wall biosynthesis